MMISDEQVRRAVEYLRTSDEYVVARPAHADAQASALVVRVMENLRELPDVRPDRIEHARTLISEDMPSADELAAKLIGRVVSDSVR